MHESTRKRSWRKDDFAAVILMTVIGACIALPALVGLVWQIVVISQSTEAAATVTGYHSYEASGRYGCDDDKAYEPVVAFRTAEGTHVEAVLFPTTRLCSPPAPGDAVAISYRNDDPSQIQDTQYGGLWWAILGSVVGGFILVVGLYLLGKRLEVRKARRSAASAQAENDETQ